MKLADCIPSDKIDVVAVERAAAIGYPAINAILLELLTWRKDTNWPVAKDLVPVLADAEIAPHINAILKSADEGWKYGILAGLAEHLSQNVWALIRPEVLRLSLHPTHTETVQEVDAAAREALSQRPHLNS